MPLPAGTSADRKRYSLNALGGMAGLVNDLNVSELGSDARFTNGSGGLAATGAMTGATRAFISCGRPIQNSTPRGFAIRSATSCPTLTPDTRRMTSPASHPYVNVWYP